MANNYAKILIVDDEPMILRSLREVLELEKYEVHEACDGFECIAKIKQSKFDAIILDIKMPKMDGMEALGRIQDISPETPVIMISGHADIHVAVESVKQGAFDFIAKPTDLNRLLIMLRNAIDKSHLIKETKTLRRKVAQSKVQEIIGESKAIQKIKFDIETVAKTEARVLVTGQNGTGKELVARWIHEKSHRRESPIVEVNCAAIPAELIESELFGHVKGSFTGAFRDHVGKFEQANGGTLFLDEIGDMSLNAQAKVLRALQESRITKVGGDKDIQVNVRVIAATNKNLKKEIEAGHFREDLYHRLAVVIFNVPSLAERREDIPLLAEHFMQKIAEESNAVPKKISEEAMLLLQDLAWTGNIRELRNVMERLFIFSGTEVTAEDVRRYVIPNSGRGGSRFRLLDLFEKYDNFDDLVSFLKSEYKDFKAVAAIA